MNGQAQTIDPVSTSLKSPFVKVKTTVPSDAVLDERYDRMSRKDFSIKTSGQPMLINDSYSNFRFSKRAGEVLSPLNKSKFGFTTRTNMRKMSLGQNQYRSDMMGVQSGQSSPKMSVTTYARNGQKGMRNNSIDMHGSSNQRDF